MILGILFTAMVLGVTAAYTVIRRRHQKAVDARVKAFRWQLDACPDLVEAAEETGWKP